MYQHVSQSEELGPEQRWRGKRHPYFQAASANVCLLVHPHILSVRCPCSRCCRDWTSRSRSRGVLEFWCVETRALLNTVSGVCTGACGASQFFVRAGTIPCATHLTTRRPWLMSKRSCHTIHIAFPFVCVHICCKLIMFRMNPSPFTT